jgi:chemotaxis protein MotA
MNITLILGFVIALGGIVVGFVVEKGSLVSLWQISAFLIVFGGTIGIAFIAFPLNSIKRIPGALKMIMFHKKHNYAQLVEMLCDVANKARKDGLLSLEAEAEKVNDLFIKKGLGYIADGVDPEFLKKMLQSEIDTQHKKYESAAAVFEGMGGSAPTMGVLGTVMGMVNVLRDMNGDTAILGKSIAVAFVATLYGVGSANLIWLPIGGHIKVVTEEESDYMEIILEGLLAIQSGEPSSRLRDRLYARISDKQKVKSRKKKSEDEEEQTS